VGLGVTDEMTVRVGFSLLSFWTRINQKGPLRARVRGRVPTENGEATAQSGPWEASVVVPRSMTSMRGTAT
jgi:hypothetical protein